MGRSVILSLSGLLVLLCGCSQGSHKETRLDCSDRLVQDSLVKKYIDSGAEKLPGMYNNPAWQLYCDSLIALCPNIAAAYQLKAVPYIKNGEYEKAFALNDTAVALDPRTYTAYRGFLKCIFTKDYEGAIVDFQKASRFDAVGYEMDHTYQFYEGLCNLELGNYPVAEENFRQDIFIQEAGEKNSIPHFNTLLYTGILYYEMKKNALAKDYLLRCLEVYPKLPEANYYLAMVYGREGNKTLRLKYLGIARQSYKEGCRMNEDNLYYANYPHEIKLYEIEQACRQ